MIADIDSREKLIDEVYRLMADAEMQKDLCENIDKLAKPNATRDIVNACETLCRNTQGCKYAEYWPDKSCDMYSACNFERTSFPGDVYDLSPGVFSFATSSAAKAYCEKTTNCLGYSLAPSTQGGKYWVYKHTTLLIRTGWKSWKVKSTCFSKRAAVTKTYGPIENWDVSEVTNMQNLFRSMFTFNTDLSIWMVSKVTSMQNSKCHLLFLMCIPVPVPTYVRDC